MKHFILCYTPEKSRPTRGGHEGCGNVVNFYFKLQYCSFLQILKAFPSLHDLRDLRVRPVPSCKVRDHIAQTVQTNRMACNFS